ncbi:MAG: hypothetical protein CL512_04020 [Actinobacteria bacterium]|nr:hypothetical protein [Actinomycetota bacterium]
MFLIANKHVGNEHIEYRDLKKTINDFSVFTTGDQNIDGDKVFNGSITFAGGVVDGPNAAPLSAIADNLWQTGQDLSALIATNISNISANTSNDAGVVDNLWQTGQTLIAKINDGFSADDPTITLSQGFSSPIISGDMVKSRAENLTVSGDNVFISGKDDFLLNSFTDGSINTSNSLTLSSDDVNLQGSTQININAPVVTIGEDVFIKGDLFVSGETVTLDVGTLSVEDKTIELGVSTTGHDGSTATAETNNNTADGAGIVVKSSEGDKTILWEKDTLSWNSNQPIQAQGFIAVTSPTSPPDSSSAIEGTIGEMRWDDNYFYIKTNNGWRRSLLMDW